MGSPITWRVSRWPGFPGPAGLAGPVASLAAEAGIAVLSIAFERWISETSQPDLPQLFRESLDEVKAVTAGK